MRRTSPFPTLLLALVLACGPGPETDDADRGASADGEAASQAIRAQVDEFLDAFNAGDAQAAAPLYTDDIVQMPPDGPVLQGRAATIQALEEFLAQFSTAPTQTATVDEVSVHGDVAIARGTWTVREMPEGVEEQVRNGKWLTVHQRQDDGSWKIWRWVWNEQRATPAAS